MRRALAGALGAALFAAGLAGCYASASPDGSTDGAPVDAATLDGPPPVDGAFDVDAILDGGMCTWFGSTRECTPWCGLPCPPGSVCGGDRFGVCSPAAESCSISLVSGWQYDCRGGRVCLTREDGRISDDHWSGRCVASEYCRWLNANAAARPDLRCRYSEGTLFVDGPPEHECALGAYEHDPLCGGRCGDACPAYMSDRGGCVGVSETRGFGVCVPDSRARCNPPPADVSSDLGRCSIQLNLLSGDPDVRCACMILSPTEPPEYSGNGWAVSLETCLAYRARYPDEVRCVDETWSDL